MLTTWSATAATRTGNGTALDAVTASMAAFAQPPGAWPARLCSPCACPARRGGAGERAAVTVCPPAARRPRRAATRRKPAPSNVTAKGGAIPGDPNAKRHRVTVHDPFREQTHTLDVPEDRYIWWYFNERGIELPASCRNGCCTTCAARILSGSLRQREALGLLKQSQADGYCLQCVSYPRSDLELVLQAEDEVYAKQWAEGFESGGVEWGGVMPEEE